MPGTKTRWKKVNGKILRRTFSFKDFAHAVRFVNRVAKLAEHYDHHPDFHIFYNKVVLELSTHSAGGLTEKDFALARKIDKVVGK